MPGRKDRPHQRRSRAKRPNYALVFATLVSTLAFGWLLYAALNYFARMGP